MSALFQRGNKLTLTHLLATLPNKAPGFGQEPPVFQVNVGGPHAIRRQIMDPNMPAHPSY
jgi:hypothetical protein